MAQPQQSVIRHMTRLAMEHGAVNLSQGFPNEPPPIDPVMSAVSALLGGTEQGAADLLTRKLGECSTEELGSMTVEELLKSVQRPALDTLNQYSIPFGRADTRAAIAEYYKRFYGIDVDPNTQVTVHLGATEAMASTFRALFSPDDRILIFEPFHEIYPNQAALFYLKCDYCTLKEDVDKGVWEVDWEGFDAAMASGVKAVVLNTPHNPTGKVFLEWELQRIFAAIKKADAWLITDDIYEHILFEHTHLCPLALDPEMASRTVLVNSISKAISATGWRVGWTISPAAMTDTIRAVHDQMALMAPNAQQFATIRFLGLSDSHFKEDLPKKYQDRRDFLVPELKRLGFGVSVPEGAYYAFCRYQQVPKLSGMGPMEACTFLVEKVGVAVVPGDNFYGKSDDGQKYLRLAFCRSMDDLQEAIRRLGKLVE